jgi:hypothetical protein
MSLDGTWSVTTQQSIRARRYQHQLELTNSHAEEGEDMTKTYDSFKFAPRSPVSSPAF